MLALPDCPVASTSCFGFSVIVLAVAAHDNGPFLLLVVIDSALGLGRGPVIQLHHLGVHFQPVADLVLGREDRPVPGKVDIGQMVVPDGVMQAERLVALAPAVAGPLVLLDDDGRHAELPQPRAERDAALAAADDERVGLRLEAEFGGFLLALFLPGRAVLAMAMLGAERAVEAGRLLMALELDHGGEQRPDLAVLQPDVAEAARHRRLEADPAVEHAVAFGGVLALGDRPVRRFGLGQLADQHVAHLVAAFHRLDVPGEGDEIAPKTILLKAGDGLVDIAGGECRAEAIEQVGKLLVGGLVEHRISSAIFLWPPVAGGTLPKLDVRPCAVSRQIMRRVTSSNSLARIQGLIGKSGRRRPLRTSGGPLPRLGSRCAPEGAVR